MGLCITYINHKGGTVHALLARGSNGIARFNDDSREFDSLEDVIAYAAAGPLRALNGVQLKY